MKSLLLLFSGIIISLFIFTGTSCEKESDCKAVVKCIDSLGSAVVNAKVQLYAVVKDPNDPKGIATFTADVKAEGNTDGGGEVRFTFRLPAIYDIKATTKIGSKTYTGSSIIKLEEGESVSKTVTVK